MASSEDTEITLGTGKLLFLFFSLVAICALFFGLGYSLGRKTESPIMTANAAGSPAAAATKPDTTAASASQQPPMTFYKAVEQKDPNPELTPATDKTQDATVAASATQTTAPAQPTAPAANVTLPTAAYFVQVAAVSKEEDANALVDALKKKDYPAFIANAGADKLFHVQVGPFNDIKDAESMRSRLISDGYNPILKR